MLAFSLSLCVSVSNREQLQEQNNDPVFTAVVHTQYNNDSKSNN